MEDLKTLEETFKRNIEFFKRSAPRLAERFEKHTPEADLVLDPKLGLNIYDRKKEAYLYPYDGRILTARQLAEWMAKPSFLTLSASEVQGRPEWLHVRYLNRLVDLRKKFFPEGRISFANLSLPALVVVGVGAGEHLKFLTSNFEIENLLILEPNEDFFYISLHLVDWGEILNPILEKGGDVTLAVGEDALKPNLPMGFFQRIGPFKVSTAFLYIHYLTEELREFMKKMAAEIGRTVSFFGFFDDEIISLRHTLTNIKNNVPLFDPSAGEVKAPLAAAVVGSGPSLDHLLPYLKRYRDRLFVISCGTAVGVLKKHGIVPDLHVNIERNEPPYEAVLKSTDEEYRKKIDFLGANNNYPPFFELFKRNAYYLKAADAGAELFGRKKKLYFVNPTVTNTGLALAYYLGFKKVFFFGVDLALHEAKHHAEGTIYDTVADADELYKGEIEVEGNFGGKLATTSIFYSSLKVMEEAIAYFSSQREGFEVFNPNRGAKIEGAKPVKEEELEKLLSELPEADLETFKREYWERFVRPVDWNEFDFPKLKMQMMTNFFQLKRVMEADLSEVSSEEDYKNLIVDFYSYIDLLKRENLILYRLLHGTMTQFLAHMMVGLYADAPLEKKREFMKEASELLKEMLSEMEKEIYGLYEYFPY